MKETILLVGGGGHCKACIDVIEPAGKFQIVGIIDFIDKLHQLELGHSVIGCDEDLPNLLKSCPNVLITLGQIKSPVRRMKLFNDLREMGAQFPVIQSPPGLYLPACQGCQWNHRYAPCIDKCWRKGGQKLHHQHQSPCGTRRHYRRSLPYLNWDDC